MNIFSYLLLTVVLVLLVNLFLEFIKYFFKTTPAMNKENSKKSSIFLWSRTRRFKFVPQVDNRDCGPAALASIAKHYGSSA
ncbi:ABC transporter ATP-binding protein [Streptococcus troglodytae]|uniref:ABC transporter ATP-binding protein n=1 Tax=Streptococcus troglodytae TaxID=1111760 RepID=A0A1L7LHD2_9STRE|nr:ABC transporter ATP-binding protein [Streptococcus troglodytae]